MNTETDQKTFCLNCTLPFSHCICSLAPCLGLPAETHILFHPKEPQKRNSSGRLLSRCLGIQSSTWHRLKNEGQAKQFQGYALLYPKEITGNGEQRPKDDCNNQKNSPKEYKGYLWIDATWQESRKMMRQSPWLDALPKYNISIPSEFNSLESQYRLRRNQTDQGLSTMETFAYWLHEQNQANSAQDLLHFFTIFQNAFLNARNSGLFK